MAPKEIVDKSKSLNKSSKANLGRAASSKRQVTKVVAIAPYYREEFVGHRAKTLQNLSKT